MTSDNHAFVQSALEGWRMAGIERDWEGVIRRSGVCERRGRARGRVTGSRRLALAVSVLGLVVVAAPALAVLAATTLWSSGGRSGVPLTAVIRTPSATVELHLVADGALAYRTAKGSASRALLPVRASRRQRFAWALNVQGARVSSAALVIGRDRKRVCAPCGGRDSGALELPGEAALRVLDGTARFESRIDGRIFARRIQRR